MLNLMSNFSSFTLVKVLTSTNNQVLVEVVTVLVVVLVCIWNSCIICVLYVLYFMCIRNKIILFPTCVLLGLSGRVVTLSPPTSEIKPDFKWEGW